MPMVMVAVREWVNGETLVPTAMLSAEAGEAALKSPAGGRSVGAKGKVVPAPAPPPSSAAADDNGRSSPARRPSSASGQKRRSAVDDGPAPEGEGGGGGDVPPACGAGNKRYKSVAAEGRDFYSPHDPKSEREGESGAPFDPREMATNAGAGGGGGRDGNGAAPPHDDDGAGALPHPGAPPAGGGAGAPAAATGRAAAPAVPDAGAGAGAYHPHYHHLAMPYGYHPVPPPHHGYGGSPPGAGGHPAAHHQPPPPCYPYSHAAHHHPAAAHHHQQQHPAHHHAQQQQQQQQQGHRDAYGPYNAAYGAEASAAAAAAAAAAAGQPYGADPGRYQYAVAPGGNPYSAAGTAMAGAAAAAGARAGSGGGSYDSRAADVAQKGGFVGYQPYGAAGGGAAGADLSAGSSAGGSPAQLGGGPAGAGAAMPFHSERQAAGASVSSADLRGGYGEIRQPYPGAGGVHDYSLTGGSGAAAATAYGHYGAPAAPNVYGSAVHSGMAVPTSAPTTGLEGSVGGGLVDSSATNHHHHSAPSGPSPSAISHSHHSSSSPVYALPSQHVPQLPPHFTQRQILPLALPEDTDWLSEFLCFVRAHCIEVFEATRDDVVSRMNSKKVSLHQVGIRCRFCAHRPYQDRAGRSSSFPSSKSRIYQSLTMMLRDHFGKCEDMPHDLKERFLRLKSNTSQGATDSKRYWVDSAGRLGLVDTAEGLKFHSRQPSE